MNLGCRAVDVKDPVQRTAIPLRVLYPTHAETQSQRFGAFPLDVATDAPPEGHALPLVVVSHGGGGSPWTSRDLAAHLVRAGFVVALPAHPGNHRDDNSLADTADNLRNRPRHIRLAIDAAYADPLLGPHLSRDGVALVGHSLGGYTALAVAGGRPSALPNQTPDGRTHPLDVEHDPRVRALVLLAPATVWFAAPGALLDVDLPILMWTADQDELTPRFHADIVLQGVADPKQLTHRVAVGGGHFSFLSPFPPAMTRPEFPPSQDPPGFDRKAFLPGVYGAVQSFLESAR